MGHAGSGGAEEDPWRILGVQRGATRDEIKRAFRELAKASHPDLHPAGSREQHLAADRFRALRHAAERALAFDTHRYAGGFPRHGFDPGGRHGGVRAHPRDVAWAQTGGHHYRGPSDSFSWSAFARAALRNPGAVQSSLVLAFLGVGVGLTAAGTYRALTREPRMVIAPGLYPTRLWGTAEEQETLARHFNPDFSARLSERLEHRRRGLETASSGVSSGAADGATYGTGWGGGGGEGRVGVEAGVRGGVEGSEGAREGVVGSEREGLR